MATNGCGGWFAVHQTEAIARAGPALETAMRQLLVCATVLMFFDRYFDLGNSKYQETLPRRSESDGKAGQSDAEINDLAEEIGVGDLLQ